VRLPYSSWVVFCCEGSHLRVAGAGETLPVMTKTDLMDHFDDIVTDRRITRELCERHLEGLKGDAYLLD